MELFADRRDAGTQLGETLRARLVVAGGVDHDPGGDAGPTGRLVIGLPRGGVLVAAEVAVALDCPLDVLVVRKLGHPAQPELGLGALAETGERVLNLALLRRLQVPEEVLDAVTAVEEAEARRRVARYRGDQPPLEVSGHEVVIVDDGLATGYTALAAALSVRHRGPRQLTVAVPVGSADSVRALGMVADDVVCLTSPPGLQAVGEVYDKFGDTADTEVVTSLGRLRRR